MPTETGPRRKPELTEAAWPLVATAEGIPEGFPLGRGRKGRDEKRGSGKLPVARFSEHV